jgi:putative FmdB family regulatory protein
MPLYEFQCKSCGHEFEDLVLGSARPACPSCESPQLQRLLSVFAVNRAADDPMPAAGACGSCGDPRGPGACSMN